MFASFCKNIASRTSVLNPVMSNFSRGFLVKTKFIQTWTLLSPLGQNLGNRTGLLGLHGFKSLCSRVSLIVNITFFPIFNFIASSNYIM